MKYQFNQDKWMRYEDDIIKYYYKRLKEWLNSGMKKSAVNEFTSGLGRNIAMLMEESNKQSKEDFLKEEIEFLNKRDNLLIRIRQNIPLDCREDIKELCLLNENRIKELKQENKK